GAGQRRFDLADFRLVSPPSLIRRVASGGLAAPLLQPRSPRPAPRTRSAASRRNRPGAASPSDYYPEDVPHLASRPTSTSRWRTQTAYRQSPLPTRGKP